MRGPWLLKLLGRLTLLITITMVGNALAATSTGNKGKVLVVLSSVSEIPLKDGKRYSTGYFLNELAVPVKALMDAGYEPVFANPKGNAAVWDTHSLNAKFFGGDAKELERVKEFAKSLSGLKKPLTFAQVLQQGTTSYAGIFVPGGHVPLGDLTTDDNLGKLLREFHEQAKPTALICHGPVALLSTLPDAKGFVKGMGNNDVKQIQAASKDWPYAGYRMTVFGTAEERSAEADQLKGKVQYYPAEALAEAGAIVESGKMWNSHVVQDRELITGRQPFSDAEFTKAFISALNAKINSY